MAKQAAAANAAAFRGNREKASARKTRRQYYTMMQQLVKKADIVIEVLDARDPAGCRAKVCVTLYYFVRWLAESPSMIAFVMKLRLE